MCINMFRHTEIKIYLTKIYIIYVYYYIINVYYIIRKKKIMRRKKQRSQPHLPLYNNLSTIIATTIY